MPRRRHLWSLQRAATFSVARTVLEGCNKFTTVEEVNAIREYTAEIPHFAAEEYLKKVSVFLRAWNLIEFLRIVLPLQCRTLTVKRTPNLGNSVKEALMSHLDDLVNLVHLTVEEVYFFYNFDNLIWQFPKLTTLVLGADQRIKSETLIRITENCPNLKKLHFAVNKFQRDPEILSICKCVQLRDLKINSGTLRWTPSDVLYLLEKLPHLRKFDVPNSSAFKEEFLIECLMMMEYRKLNQLKSLFFEGSCGKYRNLLDLLAKAIPKLERLNVKLSESVETLDLRAFIYLEKLHATGDKGLLKIPSECCARLVELLLIDLDISVLFKEMFPNLKKLELYRCFNWDPEVIAQTCPEIESLTINYVGHMPAFAPKLSDGHFIHLKHVRFIEWLHMEHILFILSSCKELKSLELTEYTFYGRTPDRYIIDDKLLNCILDKNPLHHLESLTLKTIGFRYDILRTILNSFPELHKLDLGAEVFESSSVMTWLENELCCLDMSSCRIQKGTVF